MPITSKFLSPSAQNVSDPGSVTAYIAALKAELAGYEANGDTERAAAVRKELAKAQRAGEPAETATRAAAPEKAVSQKPAARKTAKK